MGRMEGGMYSRLESLALQLRADTLRMLAEAGSGHAGGALSSADIFAVLYGAVLRYETDRRAAEMQDQFVLSIGHVAPVYYAALARSGFFPVEELYSLRKLGSRLQGHPSVMHGLPGVEVASGSLGQGLSMGVGMALANRHLGKARRTYVLLGDGELQEGQVWEAAMSAAHYSLSSLHAVVDWNRLQIDGANDEVMSLAPLRDKWESFGWAVREVNGHDLRALHSVLMEEEEGKPLVVLAHTIMGAGIPSIENQHAWHGRAPARETVEIFLQELQDMHAGRSGRLAALLAEGVGKEL